MKLITRDTDYALRSLCFMALKKKDIVSVSEMVEALKIPRPFLRKILQALHKNGILRAYKGSGGGFLLVKPKDEILLTDLIKIFQGPLKLNECFFKKLACPNVRVCPLKKKIDLIEKDLIGRLRTITLASLIK